MTINNYIPILRTKKGEFTALDNMSFELKKQITPLFEIRARGKSEIKNNVTLDEHLVKACKNILKSWPLEETCFVDIYGISQSEKLKTNKSPLNFILENLREGGLNFIPTIGLEGEDSYVSEIKLFLDKSQNTQLCVRIVRDDLNLPQKTIGDLNALLKRLNIEKTQVHLLIDLRFIHEDVIDSHIDSISALTSEIDIASCKSLIVAGSSIPEDVTGMKIGIPNIVHRKEYDLWLALNESTKLIGKKSHYADYTIINPDKADAFVPPNKIATKIRYTTENAWLVWRGRRHETSDTKRVEYQELSSLITKHADFKGKDFSWGDLNIFECAERISNYCAPGKWVEIDISHHLTFVIDQMANSPVFA